MKKQYFVSIAIVLFSLQSVFAGQLCTTSNGNYYYIKDDGTIAISEWVKVDLNKDGSFQDCYFNEKGVLDLKDKANKLSKDILSVKAESVLSPELSSQHVGDIPIEGTDPSIKPPIVVKLIGLIRYWCNADSIEDGHLQIPYSRVIMNNILLNRGYMQDARRRAVDECEINWKEHALVWAKCQRDMYNSSFDDIRRCLRDSKFTTEETEYAISNVDSYIIKDYLDPRDYAGLEQTIIVEKLVASKFTAEQIDNILIFLNEHFSLVKEYGDSIGKPDPSKSTTAPKYGIKAVNKN